MSLLSDAPWPQKPPRGTTLAASPNPTGSSITSQLAGPLRPWMLLPLNEGNGFTVRELTTQRYNVVKSHTAWTTTKDGPAFNVVANFNDGAIVTGIPAMPSLITHGMTLEAIFTRTGSRDYDALINRTHLSIPKPFDWYISTAGMKIFLGDGASQSGVTITPPPVGVQSHVLVSVRLNTSGTFWQFLTVYNGISQGLSTLANTITPTDGGDDFYVCNRPDAVPIFFGQFAFAGVWSGAMSVSEMVARSKAPWAIFDTDSLYTPPVGGSTPPPPTPAANWHFLNPQFGLYAAYLAATDSRLSSLRIEFPTRAVVLKGPQADAAVMWWIQNTPPSLRWQS